MIIHSVTPEYLLREQSYMSETQCKSFNGGYLLGSADKSGFKITRVISTNPKVYLDKNLAPGSYYQG